MNEPKFVSYLDTSDGHLGTSCRLSIDDDTETAKITWSHVEDGGATFGSEDVPYNPTLFEDVLKEYIDTGCILGNTALIDEFGIPTCCFRHEPHMMTPDEVKVIARELVKNPEINKIDWDETGAPYTEVYSVEDRVDVEEMGFDSLCKDDVFDRVEPETDWKNNCYGYTQF